MSQKQANNAFISVRIVTMDHYQGEPMEALDPFTSDRGWEIRRVPVVRVFGTTPAGQSACLHLHGIFPYLYVPMSSTEDDGFCFRLSASIDKAINTSFNQSTSTVQHVYKALKVTGRPFYGYHPRQHNFVKLYFYNYYMLKRASELLASGAILGQILQPHESHVPFELQFMMDYNLQGMNLIHLKHAVFRQGEMKDEYDDLEPFLELRAMDYEKILQMRKSLQKKSSVKTPSQSLLVSTLVAKQNYKPKEPAINRFFFLDEIPDYLKLSAEVERTSTSFLELDAVAVDILNSNQLVKGGMNPGLKVLWDDEMERRQLIGMNGPLLPPGSPPRNNISETSESDKQWLPKFDTMLLDRLEGEKKKNTNESLDPDSTINLRNSAGSSIIVSAGETDEKELGQLPEATQLVSHVTSLSVSIMEASSRTSSNKSKLTPHSQIGTPRRKFTQKSDESDDLSAYSAATQFEEKQLEMEQSDEELIDILADLAGGELSNEQDTHSTHVEGNLAEDGSLEKSSQFGIHQRPSRRMSRQRSYLSQLEDRRYMSPSLGLANSDRFTDEDELEDEDLITLEMTQRIWDVDPYLQAGIDKVSRQFTGLIKSNQLTNKEDLLQEKLKAACRIVEESSFRTPTKTGIRKEDNDLKDTEISEDEDSDIQDEESETSNYETNSENENDPETNFESSSTGSNRDDVDISDVEPEPCDHDNDMDSIVDDISHGHRDNESTSIEQENFDMVKEKTGTDKDENVEIFVHECEGNASPEEKSNDSNESASWNGLDDKELLKSLEMHKEQEKNDLL